MRLPSESKKVPLDEEHRMVERLARARRCRTVKPITRAAMRLREERRPEYRPARPLPPQNWKNTGVKF